MFNIPKALRSFLSVAILLPLACGGSEKLSQQGESCTKSADCESGLRCINLVCGAPAIQDAGYSAAPILDAEDSTTPTADFGGRRDASLAKDASESTNDSVDSTVHVTGIALSRTQVSLSVGFKSQLTALLVPNDATDSRIAWQSSNERILSVSAAGVIEGIAAGTATVTAASFDGGREASCEVAVNEQLMETVYVTGGTFSMGSALGMTDETPVHQVTLSSFYIGKYEVTQTQFRVIMQSSPSSGSGVGGTYPVYNVSWYDAVAFCNQLSIRDGLEQAYTISGTAVATDLSKNGWRLPTEAEWEFAARGGVSSKGFTYSGSNTLIDVAWCYSNTGGKAMPVGQLIANELGIYDMSGNVWEWVNDIYSNYTSVAQNNPIGDLTGVDRVYRGGGFGKDNVCYVWYRVKTEPAWTNGNLGFRVGRNYQPKAE